MDNLTNSKRDTINRVEIIVYFKTYRPDLANEFRRILGGLENRAFLKHINEALSKVGVQITPKDYALLRYVRASEDIAAARNAETSKRIKKEKVAGRAKAGLEIYDASGLNDSNRREAGEIMKGIITEKYDSFGAYALYYEIVFSKVM